MRSFYVGTGPIDSISCLLFIKGLLALSLFFIVHEKINQGHAQTLVLCGL